MTERSALRVCFGVTVRTKGSFSKATRDSLSGAWSFDQAYDIAEEVAQSARSGWHFMVEEIREAFAAQYVFSVVRRSMKAVDGDLTADDMDKLLLAVRLVLRLTTDEES